VQFTIAKFIKIKADIEAKLPSLFFEVIKTSLKFARCFLILESIMDIKTLDFRVQTKGFADIIDLTSRIQSIINDSEFTEGSALIFVPGATAGVTSIEYEPGLLQDYPKFFEKIASSNTAYAHDETWHDGNGFSHIRAALQGASFTAPFVNRRLLLGIWQQIVLVDFDNRSRTRNVVVQLTGK
jgi:secondary thiamine-phosphate synthase enzyme